MSRNPSDLDTNWHEYRQAYYAFAVSAVQVRVLGLLAGEIFKDFPRKLSEGLQNSIGIGMLGAFRAFLTYWTDTDPDAASDPRIQAITTKLSATGNFSAHKIVPLLMEMNLLLPEMGRRVWDMDLTQLLRSQELVMIHSLFDAFLADSAEVVDRGVEQHAPLMKRLGTLEKNLAGRLAVPAEERKLLDYATNVRHILVHRAGIVDEKFIQKTGSKLSVGKIFLVTEELVSGLYEVCDILSGELFGAVAETHFGVDSSSLSGVTHRAEQTGTRAPTHVSASMGDPQIS